MEIDRQRAPLRLYYAARLKPSRNALCDGIRPNRLNHPAQGQGAPIVEREYNQR